MPLCITPHTSESTTSYPDAIVENSVIKGGEELINSSTKNVNSPPAKRPDFRLRPVSRRRLYPEVPPHAPGAVARKGIPAQIEHRSRANRQPSSLFLSARRSDRCPNVPSGPRGPRDRCRFD